METVLTLLASLIEMYAAVFPSWLIGAILLIGSLRVVVKPLMSLARTIVEVTPSKSDDVILAEVEASKAYLTVVYVLDWLASLKLPKAEKK